MRIFPVAVRAPGGVALVREPRAAVGDVVLHVANDVEVVAVPGVEVFAMPNVQRAPSSMTAASSPQRAQTMTAASAFSTAFRISVQR
jgi:hypothetical protein